MRYGEGQSVKPKLSVNVRLSESQECSAVDLVTFLRLKKCSYSRILAIELVHTGRQQHSTSFSVHYIIIII